MAGPISKLYVSGFENPSQITLSMEDIIGASTHFTGGQFKDVMLLMNKMYSSSGPGPICPIATRIARLSGNLAPHDNKRGSFVVYGFYIATGRWLSYFELRELLLAL